MGDFPAERSRRSCTAGIMGDFPAERSRKSHTAGILGGLFRKFPEEAEDDYDGEDGGHHVGYGLGHLNAAQAEDAGQYQYYRDEEQTVAGHRHNVRLQGMAGGLQNHIGVHHQRHEGQRQALPAKGGRTHLDDFRVVAEEADQGLGKQVLSNSTNSGISFKFMASIT